MNSKNLAKWCLASLLFFTLTPMAHAQTAPLCRRTFDESAHAYVLSNRNLAATVGDGLDETCTSVFLKAAQSETLAPDAQGKLAPLILDINLPQDDLYPTIDKILSACPRVKTSIEIHTYLQSNDDGTNDLKVYLKPKA